MQVAEKLIPFLSPTAVTDKKDQEELTKAF